MRAASGAEGTAAAAAAASLALRGLTYRGIFSLMMMAL